MLNIVSSLNMAGHRDSSSTCSMCTSVGGLIINPDSYQCFPSPLSQILFPPVSPVPSKPQPTSPVSCIASHITFTTTKSTFTRHLHKTPHSFIPIPLSFSLILSSRLHDHMTTRTRHIPKTSTRTRNTQEELHTKEPVHTLARPTRLLPTTPPHYSPPSRTLP